MLSRRQSSRPGKWDNRNAPALVGVMDIAWIRREVRKLYIRKCAQAGVSEAVRGLIMHMAMREPDPVLLVLPDEKTGKRVMSKRILPLFEDTPCLKELATSLDRDQGMTQILLANGFNLQLGWSGSAATMAADPARFVFVDETDKSKEWTGKESGVMELVDVRTTTYDNSLIIAASTPTTDDGPISELCEGADIALFYFCPCPRCGHEQQLAFERVKYPRPGTPRPAEMARIDDETWAEICGDVAQGTSAGAALPATGEPPAEEQSPADKAMGKAERATRQKKRAKLIEAHEAAWYECERCAAVLVDSDRRQMLASGCWATADLSWKLYFDGREVGTWPVGSEVALHYPFTLSLAPKHRFANAAAEWIRCDGNPRKTQGFRNSWLGESFKVITRKLEPDAIRQKKSAGIKPMLVPSWTQRLFITVDVQGNDPSTGYFYYVIRAWGWGYRSRLIDYGIVNTFEELWKVAFERSIPFEGGGVVWPQTMLIDSGNRANEVYQYALRDTGRIKPTKGSAAKLDWSVEKKLQKASGIILWLIDTEQTKDLLNRLICDPDPAQWEVHEAINDDYCQQLTAENKTFNAKKNREIWQLKTSSTPNHLLDCEQQQAAAAWDAGLGADEPEQQQTQQDQPPVRMHMPDSLRR